MFVGNDRLWAQSLSIFKLKKPFNPLFKNQKARRATVLIKPPFYCGLIETQNVGQQKTADLVVYGSL